MKPLPDIILRIDRLVMDGVSLSPRQTTQLHRAVERELSALLTEKGLEPASAAAPVLAAPSIQLDRTVNADKLGLQIARSVYRSLTRVNS